MKKIIGIIPARYGSTRFERKLLFCIQKKPLIQYTFENAKETHLFSDLLVATDHEEIAKTIRDIGGKAVMTPSSCENGTARLAYLVKSMPSLQKADVIVNVQGDHPFLEKETINQLITIFEKDSEAQVATAVGKCSQKEAQSPHIVKCVFDKNKRALYFSRSMIPYSKTLTTYYHHLGIYAYRPSFLLEYPHLAKSHLQKEEDLEQLKILENGYPITVAEVSEKPLGIDTIDDIKQMEKRLCLANISS
jgi:3-deoxy-manno-octulosonate cytidylyltransferase (CMP-KDO synthetase)